MKPPLHQILEQLAQETGERLREAQELDIRFGEETITDLLLLELKRLAPGRIHVLQTAKNQEATFGTDWEWWVGADRIGWLRLAIQAKKLDQTTQRYLSLGHRVGGGVRQIDLLEQYAKRNRAIPLYCFYNFAHGMTAGTVSQAWHCCEIAPEVEQLSCTLTSLRVAKEALQRKGRRTFRSIHLSTETLPWRCLVKCPRAQYMYAYAATEAGSPFEWVSRHATVDWLSQDSGPGWHPELPMYIRAALQSEELNFFVDEPDAGTVGVQPACATQRPASRIKGAEERP